MSLTYEQGRDLVSYARSIIVGHFRGVKPQAPDSLKDVFSQKMGVFVTLHKNDDLRGCIGLPEPTHPLGYAVENAALSSALEDPRFPPVREDELESIVVEVSVLTKPELVEVSNPREYLDRVCVGRDGLIADYGGFRGLLLPQVPVELDWDEETFLCHTCTKAGLPQTAWLERGFKLYSFTAQVFAEENPGKDVVEKKIS